MGFRNRLERLEVEDSQECFPLKGGGWYRYDASGVGTSLLVRATEAMRADENGEERPPAHPVLVAITEAENPLEAVEQLFHSYTSGNSLFQPPCAYSLEALADYGELVPVSFAPEVEPMPEMDEKAYIPIEERHPDYRTIYRRSELPEEVKERGGD